MAISKQTSCSVPHESLEWTENPADSRAAEHVCSDHHFSGASIRPASRVVLRTADGTKVVTDLKTESGEKVMIDFRSAKVTHPILRAAGVSKRRHPGSSRPRTRVPTKGLETARLDVQR